MKRLMTVVFVVALVVTSVETLAQRTKLSPGWNLFSTQQDVEIGRQVSREAESELRILKDSRIQNYVNSLGRRLAAKAPGAKYPYQVKVVNDKTINAFALPGGFLYVHRGIIESADNEGQLAGVIAHEIAHVALRHGTNQMTKSYATRAPLAILGGLLGSDTIGGVIAQVGASFTANSILLKFSRDAERQADLMGAQILYDNNYDPRAMAQFFEKLQRQGGSRGPDFLSSHPNPGDRIGNVNQEVRKLGGQRTYRNDSSDFQRTKRNLRSI
jgi:predicted Zn-dependent protease